MEYLVTVEDREFVVDVDESDGRLAVSLDGTDLQVDLEAVRSSLLSAIIDGRQIELEVETVQGQYELSIDGDVYTATVRDARGARFEGIRRVSQQSGETVVKAPMPGLVVAVEVAPGETVDLGQGLLILEAMKMQNELRSPSSGRVREVHVSKGEKVEKGDPLLVLER